MNGFEYQAAGHMIWEGQVQEGLAIDARGARSISSRRRNPWNEVECGDHYARSMASYGVFLAACGFAYHGPKGHIGFAPRVSPENFKAAFTSAEGWGTFRQQVTEQKLTATIDLHSGTLRLKTMTFGSTRQPASVSVQVNGVPVEATDDYAAARVTVTLAEEIRIQAGQKIEMEILNKSPA